MNGSQGAPPAYMRNGLAYNESSAMRWQETSGTICGGSRVSPKWLSLSGCDKAFLHQLGASYEADLLPETKHQNPLATSYRNARTSDSCGDMGLDVGNC